MYWHCLPNFCNHQTVINITFSTNEILDYHPLLTNLWSMSFILCLPIRTGPGVFMTVLMLQYCALSNQIFWCGKVHYSDTISTAIYMSALIPKCWFVKMFSPQYNIKFSQHNVYMVHRKAIKHLLQFLIKTGFFSHSFYPQLVHTHSKNYITPMASHPYILHPITNKINSLNCWYDSLMYKKSCP